MLQLMIYGLLTAALGAAFGWSLRGGSARQSLERQDAEWSARLRACEAERDRLQRDIEVARAAANAPTETADVSAPSPPEARGAGAPPVQLDAPEGGADDLKRITGIGPGTERTLNGLGIYRFRQLAALGPDEVARIERHLRFKGRIAREDWLGQAKTLAEGGAPPATASGAWPR